MAGRTSRRRPGACRAGFRVAINARIPWKGRSREVIDGTSRERPDPAVVARDDQCPLGKWLHREGRQQFQRHSLFVELVDHHAEFHVHAASVPDQVRHGRMREALQVLARGPHAPASGRFSRTCWPNCSRGRASA
ncbi:MAG: CZB domain-containing protein [Metallibacterium sp.]